MLVQFFFMLVLRFHSTLVMFILCAKKKKKKSTSNQGARIKHWASKLTHLEMVKAQFLIGMLCCFVKAHLVAIYPFHRINAEA